MCSLFPTTPFLDNLRIAAKLVGEGDRIWPSVCDDTRLSKYVLGDAKAPALLKKYGCLRNATLEEYRRKRFRYTFVFDDWLKLCNRDALVNRAAMRIDLSSFPRLVRHANLGNDDKSILIAARFTRASR